MAVLRTDPDTRLPTPDSRPTSRRWWAVLAGVAIGLFDAAFLGWLGVRFEINGRDASVLVGLYFGLSFAFVGYLWVVTAESRRREHRQASELEALRARLAQSEKMAALGQLASAIAHEVRNPLGVIRSAAQGIGESLDGGGPHDAAAEDESRRSCRFILEEVDRLTNVIGTLLAFARPASLHRRAVSVPDVIGRAEQLARPALASKNLALRSGPNGSVRLPEIDADPDLITQVLLGLLDNAAEVTPNGGTVSIDARSAGAHVEIDVADSGPGVPVELRERVFEPFFSTRTTGTGLGLAVARQIVEAHGGGIRVAEHPGGGACFTVHLPVLPARAMAA